MQTAFEITAEEIMRTLPKDPDALIAYRFPPDVQRRMKELIAMSKAGLLSEEARQEADQLLKLEGKIVLMKVKALKSKRKST